MLLSFDPTSEPSLRSAANASLQGLRQASEGWVFCLQAFSVSSEEQVKFWCLQTIVDMVCKEGRYVSLHEAQQQSLRAALISWIQSKGGAQTDEPVSIKNKFAQLVVAILKVDYPQAWPQAFAQLLATLPVRLHACMARASLQASSCADCPAHPTLPDCPAPMCLLLPAETGGLFTVRSSPPTRAEWSSVHRFVLADPQRAQRGHRGAPRGQWVQLRDR